MQTLVDVQVPEHSKTMPEPAITYFVKDLGRRPGCRIKEGSADGLSSSPGKDEPIGLGDCQLLVTTLPEAAAGQPTGVLTGHDLIVVILCHPLL